MTFSIYIFSAKVHYISGHIAYFWVRHRSPEVMMIPHKKVACTPAVVCVDTSEMVDETPTYLS